MSSTSKSSASSAIPLKGYHLRGTQTNPNFIVNDMLVAVAGSTNDFEICRKFDPETNGEPRFKINLDGDWSKASWPAEDKVVKAGWVKISFNNKTNVITVKENQLENCAAPLKGYHLRGTQTNPNFIANDMLVAVAGSANDFEACRKFDPETMPAQPRFKINLDGDWSNPSWPAQDKVVKAGWVKISFNNKTNAILVKEDQAANCGAVSSSSKSSSSVSSESSASRVSSVSSVSAVSSASSVSSTSAVSSASSVVTNSSVLSASSKSSTSSSSAVSSSVEAVAHDFRGRTAYFVMLDRFADGNTTNNTGVSTSKANGDVAEWKKYWGGDIDGLIAKLPYLKSLGVSALVVSSLVDNTANGYQGYWARDFYAVDEHLAADISKVKKLDEETEKLGIKLVMEITLNNTSSETGEVGKLWKAKAPVISDFANGVADKWYHDNGSIGVDDCATPALCAAAWNDPLVYLTKSVGGRPDFIQGKTTNSIADEYLIGAAKFWLENGIDGFRIHSTKFIEPAFVNRFSTAVREEKADAYIFGDWPDSSADLTSAAAFVKARRGSELMDNALRNNIEEAIAGDKTMRALSDHIQSRSVTLAGKENLQAIYLDNNNDSRTSVVLRAETTKTTSRGAGKGMSKAIADARQNMGVALVMTLPGVPVIYYGTEQNTAVFKEASGVVGGEPYNRESISFTDTETPAFNLIKTLADLRKDSLAIQEGGYEERWVDNNVLVYQRETADGKDCAVVAINRGAKIIVPVKKLCLAPTTYTNLLGVDKVVVANGEANITLETNQVLVLH